MKSQRIIIRRVISSHALRQRFSKCGAQRCDRWVANGRDEREIFYFYFIYFFKYTFFWTSGLEPGSSRAVVDCYSRRLATPVDFHSAAAPEPPEPRNDGCLRRQMRYWRCERPFLNMLILILSFLMAVRV